MKRLWGAIACALCLWPPGCLSAQEGPGVITTFAGAGTGGFSGDGGPAEKASLNLPSGVALDSAGVLYIADYQNHRVRRVGVDGVITTFAGTGEAGFSGDGGPAVQARLNFPSGVAVDVRGNVYIVDTQNHRIRRVGPDGVVATFAGTGEAGFSGDGGPAVQARLSFPSGVAVDARGNVYISGNHRIRRVGPDGVIATFAGTGEPGFSGDGGPAEKARLNYPRGMAVDARGVVYIAEWSNHRIRRVGPDSVITTLAGRGGPGFSGDGGLAAFAQLNAPTGVAVDAKGNIYIADSFNYRVRRVSGGLITTAAGAGTRDFSGDRGPAVQAGLSLTAGVAVDAKGNIYIADYNNHRIRRVTSGPSIKLSTSSMTFGPTSVGSTSRTTFTILNGGSEGLSVTEIAVVGKDSLQFKVSPTTAAVAAGRGEMVTVSFTPGSSGTEIAVLRLYHNAAGSPSSVLLSGIGYGKEGPTITTFAGSGPDSAGYGGFGGDGKAAAQARLYFPQGVAVDAKGVVYIADTKNDRVRRVGTDGIISTFAGTGEAGFSGDGGPATQARLYWPSCVAVDGSGVVYTADGYLSPLIIVKDPPRYGIQRVGVDGIISTFAGAGNVGSSGDGGPALQAKLSGYVNGVAVDASGNVYIADTWNHRIRRVGTDRIITTVAGSGPTEGGFSGDGGPATQARLNTPYGVFVDGSGIIYIADGRNHRIRRVGTDGIITTFAGSGPTGTDEGGYSGDGWPATQATLSSPRAVCADANGNLYIADYANHRVRRVGPDGIITTFAGTGGGSGGDGGLAVLAGLTAPSGVAVDAQGNLYIAETGAHRIRRVTAAEVSSASLSLSAPSLAFDSTRVGSTSQLTLTISNTGGGPLSITGIALSGPDSTAFRVSPSVATIPAGQRQALTVTFAPTAAGSRSAFLSVSHNTAGSPSRVSLSGTGYVGIGPVAPTADFDGSGEVGFDDFFLFASAFGQRATGDNAKFDLDKDGEVSFGDFFLFAADFGKTVQKSTKAITVNLPGGTTMEMVWIEPGKFTMGSPSSEVGRYDNEGPQREVTIKKGFYLGKYELTQGQWQKVMGTAPWVEKNYVSVPAHPDNPAVFISWDDAQALLKKLNDAELGAGYRLPTEAEWEYAGRAGTTTRWSFGDDESRLKDYAWYGENTLNEFYVHKVGTKLPNPWGLCDMHGNVFEWVQDWYALYAIGAQTDPTGPDSGSVHVYRGGNFYFSARIMRSAYRVNGGSSYREGDLGLRLLRQGK